MSSRYRKRNERRKNLQTGEWAQQHDLFHELLPYGYRAHNPLEIIASLRSDFEQMGEFTQLWRSKDVSIDLRHSFNPQNRLRVIAFTGSWPVYDHRLGNPHSYANPLYVHDEFPAITDTEKRKKLLEATRDIPYWHGKRLARAFGCSTKHGSRLQKPYIGEYEGSRYDMGKWGRTMKTLHHWGYEWKELEACFPYTWKTLKKQSERNAPEFEPPENPYHQNL